MPFPVAREGLRLHLFLLRLAGSLLTGNRFLAGAVVGAKTPISYCPRQIFLVPGLTLALLGLLGYLIALPGPRIGGVTFDAHTILFTSLAIIAGYQSARSSRSSRKRLPSPKDCSRQTFTWKNSDVS
jgi:hypothetical protein